jgi:hypothetical protein
LPPGKPYDGHTLATVIPDMEALVGDTIQRIFADKGYRGHNAPPDYKFRVFISGQKRGMTPSIKRELRRRVAVEPVIGHLKAEHRMGRNYLWFRRGDDNSAVLAAVGYNFRRLIRWLAFVARNPSGSVRTAEDPSSLKSRIFTVDGLVASLVDADSGRTRCQLFFPVVGMLNHLWQIIKFWLPSQFHKLITICDN